MNYDFEPLKFQYHLQWYSWLLIAAGPVAGVLVWSLGGNSTLIAEVAGALPMAALILFAISYQKQRDTAIQKFVDKNNLQPALQEARVCVPACFDNLGQDREVSHAYHFQLSNGGECIISEFSFITGEGKTREAHQYTIVTLVEDKIYPHLFLDGQKNGSSYVYEESQRLALEGDFNNYFKLYAPKGDQIDTLTILSPDVMQTLLDGGRLYDIEVNHQLVNVIANGSHYDYQALPSLLKFADNLQREFDQKEVSWSPDDFTAPLKARMYMRSVNTGLSPTFITGLGAAGILLFILIALLESYLSIFT